MSTTDTEQFCPRCRAGVGSAEHHEKCVRTGHADDGEAARTPAPDTERDERLREARAAAHLIRTFADPSLRERHILSLDSEVTRLDAVVTAVREVHAPQPLLSGQRVLICQCCLYPHPCATVRALDGGAA